MTFIILDAFVEVAVFFYDLLIGKSQIAISSSAHPLEKEYEGSPRDLLHDALYLRYAMEEIHCSNILSPGYGLSIYRE